MGDNHRRKIVCWVLFVGYCGFIVWMTLLSRRASAREYELGLFWGLRMWLYGEPQGWTVFVQYINNILFFIPFGFLLDGIIDDKWKYVTAIAMVSSALIELTQYITARGLTELDDMTANTIGAGIGFLLWKVVTRMMDSQKKKPRE